MGLNLEAYRILGCVLIIAYRCLGPYLLPPAVRGWSQPGSAKYAENYGAVSEKGV